MTEKSEIKRMNAKAHKNSGRGNKKGDATWNDFVIDIKEASKSFTLNQKVWAKVTTDAIKSGTDKSPALIIVLGKGTQKVRLLIAELGVIEELVDRV